MDKDILKVIEEDIKNRFTENYIGKSVSEFKEDVKEKFKAVLEKLNNDVKFDIDYDETTNIVTVKPYIETIEMTITIPNK